MLTRFFLSMCVCVCVLKSAEMNTACRIAAGVRHLTQCSSLACGEEWWICAIISKPLSVAEKHTVEFHIVLIKMFVFVPTNTKCFRWDPCSIERILL